MKHYYLLLFFVGISKLAAQQHYYVNQNATGANNGLSWGNAFVDLHVALDHALSGDVIWVASGNYYPDLGYNRDRYFELKSGVKIYGGFYGTETSLAQRDLSANPVVLNGNIGDPGDSTDNAYTILYMAYPDSSTRLDGLIFENGYAKNDSNLLGTIPRSCGGAVYILAKNGKALPVFRHCTFRNNVAQFNGGAIYVQGQGTQGSMPIFQYCAFINNKAKLGGAVHILGGNTYDRGNEFDHCLFDGNFSLTQGGAIYIYHSVGKEIFNFQHCYFTKHSSLGGGAILCYEKTTSGPLDIRFDSCDIIGNHASSASLLYVYGFIQAFQSKFKITNSRISDNSIQIVTSSPSCMFLIDNVPITSATDSLVFSKNVFSDNFGDHLFRWYTNEKHHIRVENNRFVNNPTLSISGNNLIYSGNMSVSTPIDLAYAWKDGTSRGIQNNIFAKNGIGLNLLSSSTFPPNMQPPGGLLLLNNLFFDNDTAVLQNNYSIDSSWFYCTLSNNIFNKNAKALIQTTTSPWGTIFSQAVFSHNLIDKPCTGQNNHVICGPGNILLNDPMFGDPINLDFHLQPCSPAIQAGDNSVLPWLGILEDFDKNPRFVDGKLDIGPYESPALVVQQTVSQACDGSQGGAISLTPLHGCAPYSYQWQPAAGTGPSLNELPPGPYAFTLTDSRGRQTSDTIEIVQANSPNLSVQSTDLHCGTVIGGGANVSTSGGMPPYQYFWSHGATTASLNMLPAGSYTLSVVDQQGCLDTAQLLIVQDGQLTLMVDGTPISCFGAADARLSASLATGLAPFQYLWSEGSTDSVLTNVGPGQYWVQASDAYGCSATFTFNVTQPGMLQTALHMTPSNSFQLPSGAAAVQWVSGGTFPYTYLWSNGETSQNIHSLTPGAYTVTITDANGCTLSMTGVVDFSSQSTEVNTIQVAVWPNPVVETLEIEVAGQNLEGSRFQIYNAAGSLIAGYDLHQYNLKIPATNWPLGLYTWSLVSKEGIVKAAGRVTKGR